MKTFNGLDVQTWPSSVDGHTMYRISADREDLIDDQPNWMKRGLMETRLGYGRRLNSGYKISFNGRQYRCYITIFSNAGTMWFKAKGQRIIVS